MQPDEPRTKGAAKVRAALALTAESATPEQVLRAAQSALSDLTVGLADAKSDDTIEPKVGRGTIIK